MLVTHISPTQSLPATKPFTTWSTAEAGTQLMLTGIARWFQPSEYTHFLQDPTKLLCCYWAKRFTCNFLQKMRWSSYSENTIKHIKISKTSSLCEECERECWRHCKG